MGKASDRISNTTRGWLEASEAIADATKGWTKMRNATGAALEYVEHSACDYKVSQEMEEVNKSLTDQLESDCASSTSWIPVVGSHAKGACQAMGQWNVDRTLREQRTRLMKDCLAWLHDSPGDVVSGVAAWSKRSKESLKRRVAPEIQSAIRRARETVISRGGFETKFSLDGPALSLALSPVAGVVILLLLAAVAVYLTLRRRASAYRSILLPRREEEGEQWEASETEESKEPPAFGMLSA